MTERISKLEEHIKILTRDYKELEQALNDSINVQEEMTQKENEYKKRIKELTAQVKHFQDQGDTILYQKSMHFVEENKKLKDVIYWLNQDLDDMKQQLNTSQGIKSQYDELRQDQANLKASLVNYAKNEEKLKRNENMLENQISQLKLENSEFKNKVETHMQVCEGYKQKSQKEIEELRQKMMNMIDIEVLRQVELENEYLEKSLASEKKLVSQLKESMDLRETEVAKAIEELKQECEEKINKMVEECDEQVLIHAEALEEEKEKLMDYLKTCGRHESEIKKLKEIIDEKQSSIENQRREIEELMQRFQDTNEQIRSLEEKNQELILTIDELEKDLKDNKAKERELSDTIERLLAEKEVEDEVKRALESQMLEIEDENRLKNDKIRELSFSLEDARKENKQFEVEIEQIRACEKQVAVVVEKEDQDEGKQEEEETENFESLENKVSKGLEDWFFEEKEVILKDYRVMNEDLKRELGRANEVISELREKEVAYKSQIEELQEDYEILQKKLVSLENTNKTLKQKNLDPDEATQSLIKDLQREKEQLENMNRLLKKDLDEVFDEFEILKQEQEKRFQKISQVKNGRRKDNLPDLADSHKSFIGDRQAQLQSLTKNYIEKKQEECDKNPENDDNLEESHNVQDFFNDEKNNLREEVHSFVNQLVEGSVKLDQIQRENQIT